MQFENLNENTNALYLPTTLNDSVKLQPHCFRHCLHIYQLEYTIT
jgi:hypothetical protein